jgi:RNA polymerase sigma-70 factor (ECF subfamily)
MDDSELSHRLARDLDGTFEAVVRAHADRCFSIALRLTGRPHDAEEVVQDALVRAYRAIEGYEPDRIRELQLRPWLTTIVLNLCRNRARSRRSAPSTPLDPLLEAGAEPLAGTDTDPADLALAGVTRDRLAAHLSALPERYRVPVVLRHVDDLTYAELATVLGRPEGTIKAQVHRGLAMLRASISETEREELTA